jgi:hypothetical protein
MTTNEEQKFSPRNKSRLQKEGTKISVHGKEYRL